MENNIVTLRTAQNLESAGFPRTTAMWYLIIRDGEYELHPYSRGEMNPDDIAAPTTQELADQLPKELSIYVSELGCDASYSPTDTSIWNGTGNNIVEALANLWIMLQDPNLQPK